MQKKFQMVNSQFCNKMFDLAYNQLLGKLFKRKAFCRDTLYPCVLFYHLCKSLKSKSRECVLVNAVHLHISIRTDKDPIQKQGFKTNPIIFQISPFPSLFLTPLNPIIMSLCIRDEELKSFYRSRAVGCFYSRKKGPHLWIAI